MKFLNFIFLGYEVPDNHKDNYKKSMIKYKDHIKNFISQNELYSIY